MTLKKSEAIFRLLVGIALALGFVGFVTHSHPAANPGTHVSVRETPALVAPSLVAAGPTQVGL